MSTLDPAIKAVAIPVGARPQGAEPATTIAPPANASGQGGSAASPRMPTGVIALAATLSGVTGGTLIEALMLGRDRDGGVVLRTPNGTFVANPPAGQAAANALSAVQGTLIKVLLEAVSVGDLLQARLIAVDGRALPTPAPLTLRLTALANRPADAKPATPDGRAPAGTPERAVRPAPAPPTGPPPSVPLRQGQTLLTVLQAPPHAESPGAEPARPAVPPPALLAALQAASKASGAPAPQPPPASPPGLPQGSLVSLRVIGTLPPGAPAPSPEHLPPDSVTGEIAIEGDPEHQRLVLRLPGASLRLPPTVAAPEGTRVIVEFLASAPTAATGREPEAERLVKQLETVLLAQMAADPAAAARIAERVPAPGRKLTAAALLFLAAARQGDLGGWLEAAGDGRRAETDAPLRRLGAAWRNHAGEETEAAGGEAWRSLVLPFHDGVMLRPLVFQLRRRAPKAATPGDRGETRFLLDLDLTALGALQLDGLIRGRRFDLMLRGAARLDRTMRHELNLLFQDSLGALGYAGALAFRDDRPTAHVGTTHVEARV